MRPQHDAAENRDYPGHAQAYAVASMRPQHDAAENGRGATTISRPRFRLQ